MSYLLTGKEVKEIISNPKNDVVIVDARFQLHDSDAGKRDYDEGHLPSAIYFDLEKDLSAVPNEHGGNHPLPAITMLATKLGNAGIDQQTTVIVYDQGNDMFAPRFWWLLHYLGHDAVYILEGGYARWVAEGNMVTKEVPVHEPKSFIPSVRHDEVVHIEQVKGKLTSDEAILIDSRSKERYLGKTEPLYKKAGHIPGAKNYFWMDVLDEEGNWKNKAALEQHFANLDKKSEIIVSCGSGVSACPNVVALKMAGYTNVKLYPGSFSDWISYEDNRIETEDETNG
ncbi:sulfurtransferase [Ornithinibacillus contaminans]|uniref:sulfurtransferase n=1 Tax=Ornithinibacillus contaminans TaxID=694055 RepID=UPI00064DC9C5|nr:sulfurtransferase [Ornithinibacillus contaminans]